MEDQFPTRPPAGRKNGGSHSVPESTKIITRVLLAVYLIFGFGILGYQLYALQLRDVDKYRAEAVEQQMQDIVLPATRGAIYSSTGKLLAKSTTVWNVVVDPRKAASVGATDEQIRIGCEQIAVILDDGTTTDDLMAKMLDTNAEGKRYQYKVLAKGVEKPVADAIVEYARNYRMPAEEGETGSRIFYISKEQSSVRSYPYGAFLSSVLGFCDADGNGMYGLEKSYDQELSGTDGRSIAETNRDGEVLANSAAEVHDPINGSSLTLTIDENIQGIVEEYLAKAVEDFNVQNRGCAIVMNVRTGAILAMATIGQYDPNDPYKIYDESFNSILEGRLLDASTTAALENRLGKKETEEYLVDGLIDDSEYTTLQGMLREAQWKNKNITELYYPGSVFKLVTAASALDSGVINAGQTYYCDSNLVVNAGTQDEHTYRCAENQAHGVLDLAGALNHSCNLYFIQTAQTMSPSVFFDYFQAFGFTQTTGVDLPSETRWMQYYNAEQMSSVKTNLYTAAFGQNMAITPLQMATAVAAITKGGYLVPPYVVQSVTEENGNVIRETEPTIRRQVISEEVSAQTRTMMENNVNPYGEGDYHSCRNAYVAGYRIGGKSGTAEQLGLGKRYDGDYRKAIRFSAVLPIDDPEIEVFVMMDDPRWVEDFASQIVAPVVGNIISEVAPYLGLSRDADYNPTGTVRVNNCVGRSWTDAQVQMNLQGFEHKVIGSSGIITYQYPYASMEVPAGSTIYLYTNSDRSQNTTVPDVTGKTGSFARQMLKAAGLNTRIDGPEEGLVTVQSIDPDSSAPLGEVVTVTTEG